MNNLQIIVLGTVFSVGFIESILLNIRLKKALDEAKKPITVVNPVNTVRQKGFIDFETGKRVEINRNSGKEEFVEPPVRRG